MSSGPEHYREAERLLDQASENEYRTSPARVQAAIAHARLADIAMRLDIASSASPGIMRVEEWEKAVNG